MDIGGIGVYRRGIHQAVGPVELIDSRRNGRSFTVDDTDLIDAVVCGNTRVGDLDGYGIQGMGIENERVVRRHAANLGLADHRIGENRVFALEDHGRVEVDGIGVENAVLER